MDRRVAIALGILASAAFGYYFFSNKKKQTQAEQPQDQTPATAAQQNYTAPPNVGVQANQPGQTFVNGSQTMPLPYNT